MLRSLFLLPLLGLMLSTPSFATPVAASGATELYVSSLDTLEGGLGLTVAPLGPTSAFQPPTLPSPFLFLPITAFDSVEDQVLHEGVGLSLAAGGNSVALENFIVDRDDLVILADVSVNGGLAASDAPVFDLVDCAVGGGCLGLDGVLSLDGLGLELSSVAADVLFDVFGVPGLEDTPIGVANVHLLVAAEPSVLLLGAGLAGLLVFGRRRA
ncbi:MAG: hypothetical protein QNK05_02130 [Myxococcota bacterium]|nr:hypothetical protein [Myxococcota bacterium]